MRQTRMRLWTFRTGFGRSAPASSAWGTSCRSWPPCTKRAEGEGEEAPNLPFPPEPSRWEVEVQQPRETLPRRPQSAVSGRLWRLLRLAGYPLTRTTLFQHILVVSNQRFCWLSPLRSFISFAKKVCTKWPNQVPFLLSIHLRLAGISRGNPHEIASHFLTVFGRRSKYYRLEGTAFNPFCPLPFSMHRNILFAKNWQCRFCKRLDSSYFDSKLIFCASKWLSFVQQALYFTSCCCNLP